MTHVVGIIPARYGSTRFPGKPLADLLGKVRELLDSDEAEPGRAATSES